MADLVGRGDDVALELRLAQAIAWCEVHGDVADPAGSLRYDQLRPRVLESDRKSTVAAVVRHRAFGSKLSDVRPVETADDLKSGRLLIYFPDEELSDGAAEAETRGFFDINNAPAWDTWVGLFRDEETEPFSDYLVSWVPAPFVELVDRGICVNPEECIRWLDDSDVEVARHLRARKIIPAGSAPQ